MAIRQTKLTPLPGGSSKTISRTGSQKSLGSGTNGAAGDKDLIGGFKPLNILVFKNGDEYDTGLEMSVTRKQFQHWLNLLDYLTDRLKLTEGAVHKIYAYPSGTEVRHFTEMENAGRFFVAAHAKFKKLKYGKHPRLPNFSTGQNVKSPRVEPPSLHSKDSLQYYLKTHGFKPKLGDVWQDTDFNLMKKRSTAKSQENVSEVVETDENLSKNEDYETALGVSDEFYSAPERSKSEFGVRTLRNDESSFEPYNNNVTERSFLQEDQEENNRFRNASAKRSFSNERPFSVTRNMSDFGGRTDFNYEQRRSSGSPLYGNRSISKPERPPSGISRDFERDKTLTIIKKRNIKLQTEQMEEQNPRLGTVHQRQLITSDQSVSTDEARFKLLKKEKSYVNDYWKDKEDQQKRLKQKPPAVKTRSSSMVFGQKGIRNESLDRNQRSKPVYDSYNPSNRSNNVRESRLPKDGAKKKRNNVLTKERLAKSESEKSPRWAEDLVSAVRTLSDRVDQLSARSKREENGLFYDDED